ncbi:MAG: nucleoside-diphosphate kinase [Actinomycetota bacterium]
MSERTLVLVKPDGVRRGLVGEVLARLERRGLRVVALQLRTLDRDLAAAHYAEHVGKPFYPGLVDFITSGPLVAAVVEGPRAVAAVRAVIGATDPVAAAPGSLRGDLALEVGENLVHGSDSAAAADREVALFFPELQPGS